MRAQLLGLVVTCTLLFLVVFPAMGRTPNTWRRVDAGWPAREGMPAITEFSFYAPRDLKAVPSEPLDSFAGSYVAPGMRIDFDFGIYTGCTPGKGKNIRIRGASIASLTLRHRPFDESDSLPFKAELCARPTWRVPGASQATLGMFAKCATKERQQVAARILRTVEIHAPTTR